MADHNDRDVQEMQELSSQEQTQVQGGDDLTSFPDSQAILIGHLLPAIQKVR